MRAIREENRSDKIVESRDFTDRVEELEIGIVQCLEFLQIRYECDKHCFKFFHFELQF